MASSLASPEPSKVRWIPRNRTAGFRKNTAQVFLSARPGAANTAVRTFRPDKKGRPIPGFFLFPRLGGGQSKKTSTQTLCILQSFDGKPRIDLSSFHLSSYCFSSKHQQISTQFNPGLDLLGNESLALPLRCYASLHQPTAPSSPVSKKVIF